MQLVRELPCGLSEAFFLLCPEVLHMRQDYGLLLCAMMFF